ncbi:hypothetical protein FSARC_11194 [Fusarium sarcochroum]|uniref:Uncharacterized protein n=1 Tax=Fusarium sarcochroum TaxID=1208366 RepID=A0A8H4X1G6_9HYPO|nr:hypothetical protein FSARC_11194 [Fusarium sarcochroum]
MSAPPEDWSWECPQISPPPPPPSPPSLPVMHQTLLAELSLEDMEAEAEEKFAVMEEHARQSRLSEAAPQLIYTEFDLTIPLSELKNGTCPVVDMGCRGAKLGTFTRMEQAKELESTTNPRPAIPAPKFSLDPTRIISFSPPPGFVLPELAPVSSGEVASEEEMDWESPETPGSAQLPPPKPEMDNRSSHSDLVIPDSEYDGPFSSP